MPPDLLRPPRPDRTGAAPRSHPKARAVRITLPPPTGGRNVRRTERGSPPYNPVTPSPSCPVAPMPDIPARGTKDGRPFPSRPGWRGYRRRSRMRNRATVTESPGGGRSIAIRGTRNLTVASPPHQARHTGAGAGPRLSDIGPATPVQTQIGVENMVSPPAIDLQIALCDTLIFETGLFQHPP